MVDRSVQRKRELLSCLDTDGLSPGSLCAQITSQIVRLQVSDGRVIVCVLPNEFPDGVLGRAHGELLEDVMGRCAVDRQGKDGQAGGWLHIDGGGLFGRMSRNFNQGSSSFGLSQGESVKEAIKLQFNKGKDFHL